ncbi:MAG: hypothetical protein QM783_19885 [Phycisphaerales bacterium]
MGTYDPELNPSLPPAMSDPLSPLPEEPARWPSVLGWFSISLGVLGILKNLCGAISNLAFGGKMFTGFGQSPEQAAAVEKVMAGMGTTVMAMGALAVVSLFVSALLLIAGIQLLQRKPASAGMHMIWVAIRLVIGLAECAVLFVYQSAIMKAAIESMPQRPGGPPPSSMMGCMNVMTGCGVVVGVLWVIAYPVTVAIVLTRPWAKAEVARWRSAAAGFMP